MIIFLYGQDTYRSRQKLKEIITVHQQIHQSGLNLKIYDTGDLNFRDFKDEFQQISMFKEKKLIILEDVFLNQKFKEDFLKEKTFFTDSNEIIIFFQKGKVLENDKLTKFLKKNGKFQNFEFLKGQKLKNWVKKEFEKEDTRIETGVLEKLINFVGSDLWRMNNEIKKLVNYKKRDSIALGDIKLLVKPKIEMDIFKTIEAISRKNKKQALKFIENHLEKGDNPFYLLSMINYQFRNLLMLKAKTEFSGNFQITALSKELKIHPYPLRKAIAILKFFSLEELKKIYHKIFKADLAMKTGKINPEEGIRMLIAEI